jgi:pilus assembly protein CpaC
MRVVRTHPLAALLTAALLVAASGEAWANDAGRLYLAEPGGHEDVLQDIDIEVGKSLFIQTSYSVRRVSVGDPDVVDVSPLGTQEIQLVAKAIGTTNVVLWSPKGVPKASINVAVGAANSHIEAELRRVLGQNDVHIDGAGESVIVRGSVPTTLEMEKALKVAKAYFPEQSESVVNLLDVGGNHQVMIEITIAEINRTLTRRIGSNWAWGQKDGEIQIFSFLNGLTGFDATQDLFLLADNVNLVGGFGGFGAGFYDVFLDLVEEEGLGKILAEPTLVARSGDEASFLAGGEVPVLIPQGTANGSITVEYKDFGVGLAFTPIVMSPDSIHLDVTTEVSEPTLEFAVEVGGSTVPSFSTRRASTDVDLGDGQSFAIAGLLREDITELDNHYPWLNDIPILGALFRSAEFQKKETELVIIVTPRLAKPLDPGDPALPTDHFVEPNAFDFYFLGALEGRTAAAFQEANAQGNVEQPDYAGGILGGAGQRIEDKPAEIAAVELGAQASNLEVTPWDE